jgi:opacity protein-like surface antigen
MIKARGQQTMGERNPMKTIRKSILVAAACLAWPAAGQDSSDLSHRWRARFDIGGSIPHDPTLSELGGPVTSGDKMQLSAGIQFDVAAGYRFTPWLALEAELGFIANEVDAVGNWSYPDSSLNQMLIMGNLVFEYPRGRFVPFAGVGGGGVWSTLSFGNYYGYYYSDSDGYGSDFVPAFQAFGGVRYEFSSNWSVGVIYRFLATASQQWNIDWWNGSSFQVGVDAVYIQSVCVVMTASF